MTSLSYIVGGGGGLFLDLFCPVGLLHQYHTVLTQLFFKKINLCAYFNFFWLCWVFIAVCRLSLVAASRGYSSLRCMGFSCSGFSCGGAQALGTRASVVAAHGLSSCGSRALEHRLASCGTQAQLLRGMWDLPGPGLEPVFPALAGDS